MRRTIIMLFISLPLLGAQASASSPPQAAFLDSGFSVKYAGLAGAGSAFSEDANAVYMNPAGIRLLEWNELNFFYSDYKKLIPNSYVSAGFKAGNLPLAGSLLVSGDELYKETSLSLGASARLSDFPLRWLSRKFRYSPLAGGAALRIHSAGFGGNADGGSERIRGSSAGFSIDAGFQYEIDKVRLGLVFRNLMAPIYWKKNGYPLSRESLPLGYTIGIGAPAGESGRVMADLRDGKRLMAGIEKKILWIFQARGGYSQNLSMPLQREYTVGLGINALRFGNFVMNWDVSYGFEAIENTLRTGFSILYRPSSRARFAF